MHRIPNRLFLFLFMMFTGLMSPAAAATFDVSYVWSRNLDGVRIYQEQVARVLGPGVAKDLKVVARDNLFGLVYARRGDRAGAVRVAQSHSRLLQSRGLEAAAPVRSQDWVTVGARAAARAAISVPKVARGKMTATQRTREILDLGAAVEAHIAGLRRKGVIAADERTAWSVYDFTTGEKLVTINENQPFQAASLVKPFIAAAFFHKVKQGELIYGPRSRRHMELMIQHSDNAATNWVMRQVGGPRAVERILKRHYPGIFRETHLVEYIPSNGRTYRNTASAHDYSRFLYAVWKGDIAGAREIKRLMALPGSDRIYTGVQNVPKTTRVYNKTGSTARVCGDMGILSVQGADGKRYPYTVIGIIEKDQRADNYTTWIRSRSEVIRNVSGIIYSGIAQYHNM